MRKVGQDAISDLSRMIEASDNTVYLRTEVVLW